MDSMFGVSGHFMEFQKLDPKVTEIPFQARKNEKFQPLQIWIIPGSKNNSTTPFCKTYNRFQQEFHSMIPWLLEFR